ncbi:MAG: two-component regulator propeller domain-containing protein, partial [Rubricoccaceae bacterium]|nr:two-component regulator propeller domain-containing protein [Rubricoccaceae bacterium]
MSPRIVLTLALLGNAVPLQAQVQQTTIRLDHLTVEDGLSDGGVNALVQDEHGFLWIGTGDGLNRYDGYGFTVFRHDPADPHSLYDTTIYGLALASGGGLWIATFSGIEHYDPVTGAFTRYADDSGAPDRLPYDEYYEVLEDQHGDVWAGSSRHGVFRLDPATGAVTAFPADPDDPSALLHESVVEIVETRDGTLWVATGRNGLHRFDPATDAFVRVPVAEPGLAESDGFFHIEEDPDGALWLGGWGLTRLDPATGETVRFLPAPDLPEPDPPRYDNYVSSLVWDRQGRLWVGTFHKGLYRFDPATEAFTHFPPDPGDPTSLLEDTINRMLLDRSGVLWVGMDEEGLSRLDPRREHVIRLSAPEHEGLDEVREDHEGALWLVFEQTLVRWDPATGQSTVYRHGRGSGGLTDSRIFSLHTVPSMPETIWIGDRDGILHRMDAPGRIAARYALVPDPDWEGNPVFEVVEVSTQPGVLWVA